MDTPPSESKLKQRLAGLPSTIRTRQSETGLSLFNNMQIELFSLEISCFRSSSGWSTMQGFTPEATAKRRRWPHQNAAPPSWLDPGQSVSLLLSLKFPFWGTYIHSWLGKFFSCGWSYLDGTCILASAVTWWAAGVVGSSKCRTIRE